MSKKKRLLKAALKRERQKERRARAPLFLRILGKLLAILVAVYAALFAVFFFDIDGKLLYYVVEPFLIKHYDKMERRNPLDVPYSTEKAE